MYEDAMRAAGSQLLRVSDPSKFTYIVSLYGDKVDEEMQHLACFLGGLYALGAYPINLLSLHSLLLFMTVIDITMRQQIEKSIWSWGESSHAPAVHSKNGKRLA